MTIDLSPSEAAALIAALRYKADALRLLKDNVAPDGQNALDVAAAELDLLAVRIKDSTVPRP
jgi:hypothetical protein